jgi:uncharacterized protein YegJ (DUF2314 family)
MSPDDAPRDEPLFVAVASDDPQMGAAHSRCAQTLDEFRAHVLRAGDHLCAAKLRFRDPGESDRAGHDVLLYVWLASVFVDESSGRYVGSFFEVPPALREWHSPGQELEFEGEDVFDWMVNDDGVVHGGFTLRVMRGRLPESEREAYDQRVGAREWARS